MECVGANCSPQDVLQEIRVRSKCSDLAQVTEGLNVLDAISEAACDATGRPLQNIRIRHTVILDDPFPDPPQLAEHVPDASPELVRLEVPQVLRSSSNGPLNIWSQHGDVHDGIWYTFAPGTTGLRGG